MKTQYYKDIDETVYHHTCDNGLNVFVINKPGFSKKYATYTTKYGSMDDHFIVNGEEYQVPDGIAHFLEHKMFEKESGDMFHEFTKYGASANAFTSYDRTCYLFSTTNYFKENLKLLMSMVEQPYFTKKTVEKEVGIIEEEIKMYQDNPSYRVYFETLQLMYNNLPIKKDIAGSIESIHNITAEHLYLCHETFYHPSNMVLVLVGDFNVEEIINFVDAHQLSRGLSSNHSIERVTVCEENSIYNSENKLMMDVTETKAMIGFKNKKVRHERLKVEFSRMIALNMAFGQQSHYYYQLIEENLIDESFAFDNSDEPTHSHILFTTNTEQPEVFSSRLSEIIKEINQRTDFFTEEKLRLEKREIIGDYLSNLNSPEYIANYFTDYYFNDTNFYEVLEVVDGVTVSDVTSAFNDALDDEKKVLSVVTHA